MSMPDDAFIVGGSGSISQNKGVDIFVEVAARVRSKMADDGSRPIRFVWLGGHYDDEFSRRLFQDRNNPDATEPVAFLGAVTNPIDYYRRFDLFFLSSREDAFPLVVIENASVGTPVLCFDRCNGSVEVLDPTNAYLIPYPDVEAAAEAVITAYQKPETLQRKGENIRARFSGFTVDKKAAEIFEIICAASKKV